MRFLLPAIALTFSQGCAGSQLHAILVESQVSGERVKAGRNPHLRIGMPVGEAKEHLEYLGFFLDTREHPESDLPDGNEFTLRYVRNLPCAVPFVVAHYAVHVVLFHDGERLTDLRSETIHTTVD